MDRFIIVNGNNEPAWFGEENEPVVFYNIEEATTEFLDDCISNLQMQLDQVKDGSRQPDEVDTVFEDYIIPCTVSEDGVITTEMYGVIYDPKTFVR